MSSVRLYLNARCLLEVISCLTHREFMLRLHRTVRDVSNSAECAKDRCVEVVRTVAPETARP